MAKFEEYKEARKIQREQTFYDMEKDKGLPAVNDEMFKYDPKQFMEYLEARNQDDKEFKERTRYYFEDDTYGDKKRQRYRKIHENRGQEIQAYAEVYTNRGVRKRKIHADAASKSFETMAKRMRTYKNSKGNAYMKYLQKEDIMQYRLKGMEAAAVVKSKSASHEKYLKSRARLSCNMILKDQLDHLIKDEKDPDVKNKLEQKRTSVQAKIDAAYRDLQKSTMKIQDVWKIQHGINKDSVKDKHSRLQRKDPDFTVDDTSILMSLETLQEKSRGKEWPERIVFEDDNHAPLNYAEAKNRDFNHDYRDALQRQDQDAIKNAEMDAIKRFEKFELPKPSQLDEKGTGKYINEYLREYYDLTKRALPYYKNKIGKPGVVGDYIAQHPEFLKRLIYVNALDRFIDFKLRSENGIEFANGFFRIEQDPQYRVHRDKKSRERIRNKAYGAGQGPQKLAELTRAYKQFQSKNAPNAASLFETEADRYMSKFDDLMLEVNGKLIDFDSPEEEIEAQTKQNPVNKKKEDEQE